MANKSRASLLALLIASSASGQTPAPSAAKPAAPERIKLTGPHALLGGIRARW
jgi:hypothetical protein